MRGNRKSAGIINDVVEEKQVYICNNKGHGEFKQSELSRKAGKIKGLRIFYCITERINVILGL